MEADVIARSYIIDDLSRDRALAVRVLQENAELLADGLHALRHGRPAVADEFMERALAAITTSLAVINP